MYDFDTPPLEVEDPVKGLRIARLGLDKVVDERKPIPLL
jgi:hypothetical protein